MNEAVKGNELVQLTYTVKLVNPKNNQENRMDGTMKTKREHDGFTNQKAVLHLVEAIRKRKTEVFSKIDCIIYDSEENFRRFQRRT